KYLVLGARHHRDSSVWRVFCRLRLPTAEPRKSANDIKSRGRRVYHVGPRQSTRSSGSSGSGGGSNVLLRLKRDQGVNYHLTRGQVSAWGEVFEVEAGQRGGGMPDGPDADMSSPGASRQRAVRPSE